MLLLSLFSLFISASCSYTFTYDQQVAIEEFFLDVLNKNAQNIDSTPGDSAAAWVRLCFHDAVTWNPKTRKGGAHACSHIHCDHPNQCEYTLDANKGLPITIDALEDLWITGGWQTVISRPDFWHLSCKVAIEWASGGNTQIDFGWGRTECKEGLPLFANTHPNAAGGFAEVQKHLVQRLGFTWEEAIALLGAHSLGETRRKASGFEGRWVPNPANYFSNNFYKVLLQNDWYRIHDNSNSGHRSQSRGKSRTARSAYPTDHPQFISDQVPGGVMLYTDIGVGWDITKGICNVTSERVFGSCPTRPYLSIIQRFADDGDYWLKVFARAFQKLQSFGGDDLSYFTPESVAYSDSFSAWNGFPTWYTNPFDYGTFYNNGNGFHGSEYLINKQVEDHSDDNNNHNDNSGSDNNNNNFGSGFGSDININTYNNPAGWGYSPILPPGFNYHGY